MLLEMSAVKHSKDSCIVLKEIEIISDQTDDFYDETDDNIQNSSTSPRIKFNESTASAQRGTPNVILNNRIKPTGDIEPRTTINIHSMKLESNIDSFSLSTINRDDFLLKNENNCFYKCVHCLQTIKSKPSYKSHLLQVHNFEMSKYHTQKGFIDATEEFCSEFVQTDFNIVQTLTSILDQIENIDKIIQDHKKHFQFSNNVEEFKSFLENEKNVLQIHGEMIERAFDILAEKKNLIFSLQEDVTELLEQSMDPDEKVYTESVTVEEEPKYELYYVVEDVEQDKDDGFSVKPAEPTTTSLKRGRPKGMSARSLDNCLTELPEATAEYVRTLTTNEASKYQCNMCDVSSKTKMLLCVHYMRVHLKIKNKICHHCDRPFASQGDLTRHIRIHTHENPFKCDHPKCPSEFKTSGDLKKHKLVHERDPSHRPFHCDECESKFARQTDYRRHKKIHLIGKNENVGFRCELCRRVFYRKDLLRAHLNNHLQIKPFECETCLKRFAKKYDLLKHIEKQHQQLDCDNCEAQFGSRLELEQHFSDGFCNGMVLS